MNYLFSAEERMVRTSPPPVLIISRFAFVKTSFWGVRGGIILIRALQIDFILNEHSLFLLFTYDRWQAIDCLLGRAPLCFLALRAWPNHPPDKERIRNPCSQKNTLDWAMLFSYEHIDRYHFIKRRREIDWWVHPPTLARIDNCFSLSWPGTCSRGIDQTRSGQQISLTIEKDYGWGKRTAKTERESGRCEIHRCWSCVNCFSGSCLGIGNFVTRYTFFEPLIAQIISKYGIA